MSYRYVELGYGTMMMAAIEALVDLASLALRSAKGGKSSESWKKPGPHLGAWASWRFLHGP